MPAGWSVAAHLTEVRLTAELPASADHLCGRVLLPER